MAGYALIILGTGTWFNFMGKVFPKRDVVSTLKKLLLGNFAYGPLINSAFFSFNAALQGICIHFSCCSIMLLLFLISIRIITTQYAFDQS